MIDLPAELWNTIFDIAADEHVIFNHNQLTVMAESMWAPHGQQWQLVAPEESLDLIQKRSYATKKAVISTCRTWRRLGAEFMVRCLFFEDSKKLQSLASVLEQSSNLGWWTRRLHVKRFYEDSNDTMDSLVAKLVAIIRMCPNLEIFVMDWPMGMAFRPIAYALCTYCVKSLRSVRWHVPYEAVPKVIWALDTLQSLQSVYIEVAAPVTETIHLSSAADLQLELKNLQQLSLQGHFQDLLEQITGWSLPSLHSVSFNFLATNDLPDIMEFLTHHGSELTFLDLHCEPTPNTAAILDLCPFLTTFTFNADGLPSTPGAVSPSDVVTLVNRPHQNITQIGCHGLLQAFGAVSRKDDIQTHRIQTKNETNIAALTKANFPNLKKVRVLSRPLLRKLEKSDGPEEEYLERWDRWWTRFAGMRVRLEDCTGALLGTLPQVRTDEGSSEEESEDEGDENIGGPRLSHGVVSELRQLLEECWKMSEEREEFSLPELPF